MGMGIKYRKYSLLRDCQGCQEAWVVPVEYQGRAGLW